MSAKIISKSDGGKNTILMPNILYEDDALLIADKPAGMLSLEDSTGRQSLSSMVAEYLKKSESNNIYCAPIHRLDRPVSGTMLFAKNHDAARILSCNMKDGKIQKFYFALVNAIPGNSEYNKWALLEQNYIRRRDRAYIAEQGAPRSSAISLRYKIFRNMGRYTPVLINLITGKRHQIRVQMSSQSMPIAGDRFYGSGESFENGIICLHAIRLEFRHPVTNLQMNITAPLPDHFSRLTGNLNLNDIEWPEEFRKII